MFRVTEAFAISIPAIEESNVVRVTEALLPAGGSTALEIKIAAIHEGLTRNKTYYTREGLTHENKDDQGHPGGLKSWLEPLNAPIIKNHDSSDVDNVIGRVIKSEWVEKQGKEPAHVELTAQITNPDAIAKVLRGEYQTGSVGLDVEAAHCNICNADLQKEHWGGAFHEHMRGQYYKKAPKESEMAGQWLEADKADPGAKMAYILVGNVYGREYSMVVTPSDARSRVKSMELKEMTLKQEGHKSLDFLNPMFKESVSDDVLVMPEETVEKSDRSIAELMKFVCNDFPIQEYVRLATSLTYTQADPSHQDQFTIGELEKLTNYILENNEDLEDELNDIKECVLSTETNTQLPDNAFAFIYEQAGNKVRLLPYKNGSGQIDKALLRTSLGLVESLVPEQDYTRVYRKLRAAAIKAGMRTEALTGELLQEALADAKSFLLENGQAITETEIVNTDNTELLAKLEAAETEVATLRREALDRDSEFDTLTEQIETLGQEIDDITLEARANLVNAIITVDLVDESEKTAKIDELMKLDNAALQTLLHERSSEQGQLYVSAKVPRAGRGQGTEDTADTTEELKNSGGVVLASLFGSKTARKEVARMLKGVQVAE